MPRIVSDRPVLLAGGGPIAPDTLSAARAECHTIVAADGAADQLKALGVTPDAIIGDLDSLSDPEAWRAAGVPVHHDPNQDTTDFEKVVTSVEAPLILAVGFVGARLDHTLAVMSALSRFHSKNIIVLGEEDVICALPEHFAFEAPVGARISLFPMAPVTGLASTGLRWPIDGLSLAPSGVIGTSNEATATRISLTLDRPGLLLIVPKFMLPQLLDAQAGA